VESGNDYHSWNIQEFFGISYSDVWDQKAGKSKNKDLRELSKRVNHGANYNMTEYAMLDTMGPLHVQKAKEILKLPVGWSLLQCCKYLLEQYAKTYIRVKKDWYQSVVVRVETQQRLISAIGWTRYCFGKPRYSKPALNSYVAHEPQNLSVSIINRAFYRIWRDLQLHKFAGKFRLKAQIHDEIIFEYLPEIEAECIAAVTDLMTIPTEVKDVGGKKRTMIIKPSMSYGADRWSKLK
jgi:DNA polymerase I-like protein with 3'-5' exonuclease and polymerase domains